MGVGLQDGSTGCLGCWKASWKRQDSDQVRVGWWIMGGSKGQSPETTLPQLSTSHLQP